MKAVKFIGTMGLVAGLWLVASTSAHATLTFSTPMTYTTAGLVGTAKALSGDGQGNPTLELQVAQSILNVDAGLPSGDSSGRLYIDNTTGISYSSLYGGTISNPSSYVTSTGSPTSVAAGWTYVIAKYDGPNGGYILFYLGGQAATLPGYSSNIWGTGDQYGISGFTAFDATNTSAVPEPSTIAAGGLVLLPLIAGLLRAGLRRNSMA